MEEKYYSDNNIKSNEELIKEAIKNEINDDDYSRFLSVEKLKGEEISIKAKCSIVAKMIFRKKISSYIIVRVDEIRIFDNCGFDVENGEEWIRIYVKSIDDVISLSPQLSQVYMNIIKRFEHESFGCCSRYMACSDAKKCVHPNKILAEACQYKTNLDAGRIFYGENRNID